MSHLTYTNNTATATECLDFGGNCTYLAELADSGITEAECMDEPLFWKEYDSTWDGNCAYHADLSPTALATEICMGDAWRYSGIWSACVKTCNDIVGGLCC